MTSTLRDLLATSALASGNGAYVDELYERFLADPSAVPPAWQSYFRNLGGDARPDVAHGPVREQFAERARRRRVATATAPAATGFDQAAKQGAVSRMIQVYANRGHLVAHIDPL